MSIMPRMSTEPHIESTRVYLDDCRPPPDGWISTKTAPETIERLARGGVTHLSLDHDLGDEPGAGNGYDVLVWLERQVAMEGFTPPSFIDVHSANVGARPKMEAAIRAIRELQETSTPPAPEVFFQPRVMRHRRDDGRCEYAIHDVYFDKADGRVVTYPSASRSNRFATVAELEAWIVETLPRAADGIICGDLGHRHSAEHLAHWLRHIDDPVIDYED